MRGLRGNYALILAISLTMLLGFAALAVDLSMVRATSREAQVASDAAAMAAAQVYKDTRSIGRAKKAAETVANTTSVGGSKGGLKVELETGQWRWGSYRESNWKAGGSEPNAIRVRAGRARDGKAGALPMAFAPAIGAESSMDVLGDSVVAIGHRDVMIALDASFSMEGKQDIVQQWMLDFLDAMYKNRMPGDEVGLIVFTGSARWGSMTKDNSRSNNYKKYNVRSLDRYYSQLRGWFKETRRVNYCARWWGNWRYYYRFHAPYNPEGWSTSDMNAYLKETGYGKTERGDWLAKNWPRYAKMGLKHCWYAMSLSYELYKTRKGYNNVGPMNCYDTTSLYPAKTFQDKANCLFHVKPQNASFKKAYLSSCAQPYYKDAGSDLSVGLTRAQDSIRWHEHYSTRRNDALHHSSIILISDGDPECVADGKFDGDNSSDEEMWSCYNERWKNAFAVADRIEGDEYSLYTVTFSEDHEESGRLFMSHLARGRGYHLDNPHIKPGSMDRLLESLTTGVPVAMVR